MARKLNVYFTRRGAALALISVLSLGMLALAACGNDDDDANGSSHLGEPAATAGDLTIYEPWIRYTLGDNAAGYFVVVNDGDDDRLVQAQLDVAGVVELHEVITDGAVGRMQEVEGGIEIPAGSEVELRPGGYHVMLMALERELEQDEELTMMLVFENAGEVTVTATVETVAAADDNGHGHSHDDGMADDHGHDDGMADDHGHDDGM